MNLMSSFSISVLSNLNFLSLESSSAIFCKFFLFTEFNCCILVVALSKIKKLKNFFFEFSKVYLEDDRVLIYFYFLRILIFRFLFWSRSRRFGKFHILVNSSMMNMFTAFWTMMIWWSPCRTSHLEKIIFCAGNNSKNIKWLISYHCSLNGPCFWIKWWS